LINLNDTNKELERNRLDMQLRMFGKSMEYKRHRDNQLAELARQTLLNQNLMVQAIVALATAFQGGSRATPSSTKPTSTAGNDDPVEVREAPLQPTASTAMDAADDIAEAL
jgi:hypothetical protein